MPQKKSASEIVVASEKPVPYRLAFRTSEKRVPATLTSPLLDRALHERGRVSAYFKSVSGRGKGGKIALDAFEAASLTAYLQNQASVRQQLEDGLSTLLKNWDKVRKIARGGDMWERTKIKCIEFSPRTLPTPEDVKLIQKGYSKKLATKILRENFDTADARSSFLIIIQPEWADDQYLLIQFRDGEAMALQEFGD